MARLGAGAVTCAAVFLASLVDLISGKPGYAVPLFEDVLLDGSAPP